MSSTSGASAPPPDVSRYTQLDTGAPATGAASEAEVANATQAQAEEQAATNGATAPAATQAYERAGPKSAILGSDNPKNVDPSRAELENNKGKSQDVKLNAEVRMATTKALSAGIRATLDKMNDAMGKLKAVSGDEDARAKIMAENAPILAQLDSMTTSLKNQYDNLDKMRESGAPAMGDGLQRLLDAAKAEGKQEDGSANASGNKSGKKGTNLTADGFSKVMQEGAANLAQMNAALIAGSNANTKHITSNQAAQDEEAKNAVGGSGGAGL